MKVEELFLSDSRGRVLFHKVQTLSEHLCSPFVVYSEHHLISIDILALTF